MRPDKALPDNLGTKFCACRDEPKAFPVSSVHTQQDGVFHLLTVLDSGKGFARWRSGVDSKRDPIDVW